MNIHTHKIVDGKRIELTQDEIAAFDARDATVEVQQFAQARIAAWETRQRNARLMLAASDLTVLRCIEHGVALPAEWIAYRAALRVAVTAPDNGSDATANFPIRPAYPQGT